MKLIIKHIKKSTGVNIALDLECEKPADIVEAFIKHLQEQMKLTGEKPFNYLDITILDKAGEEEIVLGKAIYVLDDVSGTLINLNGGLDEFVSQLWNLPILQKQMSGIITPGDKKIVV